MIAVHDGFGNILPISLGAMGSDSQKFGISFTLEHTHDTIYNFTYVVCNNNSTYVVCNSMCLFYHGSA
jgi:hypothetical protein